MYKYKDKIKAVIPAEVIDSRGNPTIEVTVICDSGATGRATAPSGASTGAYEAHEKRDNDKYRFGGKGVLRAVENVRDRIAPAIVGRCADFSLVDDIMLETDGSYNKSELGANAILAVSLAVARAGAAYAAMPLWRYIGGEFASTIPVPLMNVLNGGAHASNNLDIQEFMIAPISFPTYSEALRAGCEIYHVLGNNLKSDGKSISVGDEGGFAPDMSSEEEALDYLVRAIEDAGYTTDEVKIALDVASSEWVREDKYMLPKSGEILSSDGLISKLELLTNKYPIISIEDGLGEDDIIAWSRMTGKIGDKVMLVGDDFFVTNKDRLVNGIKARAANSILIKPNQIGTLSETLEVIRLAKKHGYTQIMSHRSGESSDTTISDLAVACSCDYIKTGAPCRGERTSKYNRLLTIERELGKKAIYSGSGI